MKASVVLQNGTIRAYRASCETASESPLTEAELLCAELATVKAEIEEITEHRDLCQSDAERIFDLLENERSENRQLRAKVAEMEAIVAKLPKTANEALAYDGMKVWFPWKADYDPGLADGVVCYRVSAEDGFHCIDESYSTIEAAKAAEVLAKENEMLKAAIATPEVYAGVITKVVEDERDAAVGSLVNQNKAVVEREVKVANLVKAAERSADGAECLCRLRAAQGISGMCHWCGLRQAIAEAKTDETKTDRSER